MDAVPAFAAVSESVDQVREVAGGKPSGLVNAVLRRVAEAGDGPDRFPDPDREALSYLETWGSHPRWLLERWLERWSFEDVRALVLSNNRRPPTYLVALDLDSAGTVDRLREAGIAAQPVSEAPTCVRLADGASPAAALAAVPRSLIQDPAAGLVARYADFPAGTDVADLCAAPGGKALVLAGRARRLVAADLSERRLRLVRENARRTGSRIDCVVADALAPPLASVGGVLLDAPCSGTGTLARHPDARWRLDPGAIERFAALQARMLDAAASIVSKDGWLVYSTCTLEPEENGDRIDRFLGTHRHFELERTGAVPEDVLDASGRLMITPQGSGHDGAFAARMRRIA